MDKETIGTVLSVAKQWWLKVNTKSIRMGALDGATFPHIIKVQYGRVFSLRGHSKYSTTHIKGSSPGNNG